MADNQTAVEDPHQQQRSTSTPKSMSTVPGTLSSKSHSMKHGHTSKAATMISPENKHHHHHHHSHHHSHHNNPHVIHKTTSESLRLGADVNASGSSVGATTPSTNSSSSGTGSNCNSVQLHFNAPGPISRKPKTSSFQITSVTVGNKLSADNGEDSADDLDESHTDDNSRITDLENETPSVSEDTFSKEDVFFSSNALGTAPVIPTSSQYGLVIVDPDLGGVGGASGQSLSNVHVSVTDAGINIVGPAGGKLNDGDQKELQHRNERFKVVKIESTEPFKRGRWMCMDYLDHTTLQQTQTNTESTSTPSTGTAATVTTNDSGVVTENHVDSGENIDSALKVNFNPSTASPGQTLQNPIPVSVTEQQPHPAATAPAPIQVQTLSHVPNVPSNNVQQQNASAQSLPPVQLQHAISGQVSHQSIPAQAAPEFQPSVTSNANIQGQSQPAHFYVANQPQPVIAPTHVHGATLPSNINMQNGAPTNVPSQPQQHTQPQTMSSINVSMSVPSSTITSEQAAVNAASSLPQSMVQPSIANQQANVIQPPQQALTTHSAPQTQVPSDLFIAQSVPQSYTTPPVSSSTMSVASNTNITSQDIQSSSESTMPPTQSNVISPAGANTGVLPIAEGANVQGAQQQSVTPGITNVIQDTITPTAASTISDPTVISAAIQAQQQVTPAAPSAPATLQTQQSVVNNEETQQPPVETDSESVSGLTLALSSSRERASSKLGTTSARGPAQSSLDSKLPLLKLGSSMQKGSDNRRPHSRGSCTHIALGDCIQKLMGVKEDAGEEAASSSSAADRKVEPVEEPQGIPIPRSSRVDATTAIAHSASPTHGSPFYCSSPSTVPAAPQVATSYDTRFAGNPGLRVIGKTMSIPTSFSYRPLGAGSSSSSQRSVCSAGAGADNSASGTSAVAIDNKIEQAMDLVKSHLMIAVREEVEVLKEKIAELMDRINQLELENTILKANVPQETLSQLSATMQTAATKPPQNTNTSNGPVS